MLVKKTIYTQTPKIITFNTVLKRNHYSNGVRFLRKTNDIHSKNRSTQQPSLSFSFSFLLREGGLGERESGGSGV